MKEKLQKLKDEMNWLGDYFYEFQTNFEESMRKIYGLIDEIKGEQEDV